MANFTLVATENVTRGAKAATSDFHSWSPYPQPTNKKTELINRLGAIETLTQQLYDSSVPITAMAINFFAGDNTANLLAAQTNINSMVGIACTLTDNINTLSFKNLVITDLTTRIKKVGGGWLLICEFTQHIRKA